MTPEQIQELVTKYGQPAVELAYRQVVINVILTTVLAVAVMLLSSVALVYCVRRYRKPHGAYEDNDGWGFAAAGLALMDVVAGIAIWLGTLPTVLNLDRAALSYLLGMFPR